MKVNLTNVSDTFKCVKLCIKKPFEMEKPLANLPESLASSFFLLCCVLKFSVKDIFLVNRTKSLGNYGIIHIY